MSRALVIFALVGSLFALGVAASYAQTCPPGSHVSRCWNENTANGVVEHCDCVRD